MSACACRSLEWLCETCRARIAPAACGGSDGGGGGGVIRGSLLELHCGFAHSTVALAPYFSHVVGVEMNRCEKRLSWSRFLLKTIIYQDRLGTNIGKVDERGVFRRHLAAAAEHNLMINQIGNGAILRASTAVRKTF